MKDFWNQRYAENNYAYSKKPNEFFKSQLGFIPKGKILFVAEGEGRNAVYAAQQDFEVYAFDISDQGKLKADCLAHEHKVGIKYYVADIKDIHFEASSFDAIVFIFAHFPMELREIYFQKALSFLKPSGHVVFEAFGKEQIHLHSGGPKQIEMLFSESEVKAIFSSIDFKFIKTCEILLDEGPFHQGKANVVRFIGNKIHKQ